MTYFNKTAGKNMKGNFRVQNIPEDVREDLENIKEKTGESTGRFVRAELPAMIEKYYTSNPHHRKINE